MPLQTKMRLTFGVLVLLLFAWAGWQALEFARLARYLPLAMSGLGMLIGLLAIGTDLLNWKRQGLVASVDVPETAALHGAEERELALRRGAEASEDEIADADAEGNGEQPTDPRKIALRSGIMFGWVLGYVLLIWVIGLVAASALFLITYLRFVARSGWLLPLAGTAIILTGMWLLRTLLNLRWPSYLLQDVLPFLGG